MYKRPEEMSSAWKLGRKCFLIYWYDYENAIIKMVSNLLIWLQKQHQKKFSSQAEEIKN
jgi:hypothetical protein